MWWIPTGPEWLSRGQTSAKAKQSYASVLSLQWKNEMKKGSCLIRQPYTIHTAPQPRELCHRFVTNRYCYCVSLLTSRSKTLFLETFIDGWKTGYLTILKGSWWNISGSVPLNQQHKHQNLIGSSLHQENYQTKEENFVGALGYGYITSYMHTQRKWLKLKIYKKKKNTINNKKTIIYHHLSFSNSSWSLPLLDKC